ncbi:MAG: TIGR02117 family protein [Planctomycetes bacterium]|nr:TIGR02117 family protein [Planctomycetota bacterium]
MTAKPSTPEAAETDAKRPGPLRRLLRWPARFLGMLVSLAAAYTLLVLVLGAIPVNGDFKETPDGIEIMVHSNGIHVDFQLPVQTAIIDWRDFAPLESEYHRYPDSSYALIGWGDRGFYLEVEEWEDLELGIALNATLRPTPSVMHLYYALELPEESEQAVRLRIHPDQYRSLVEFIQASFAVDDRGNPILIPGHSYTKSDVFYEGRGSYHLFNTCNNWANRALKQAGITTPMWAPFDGAIMKKLPR